MSSVCQLRVMYGMYSAVSWLGHILYFYFCYWTSILITIVTQLIYILPTAYDFDSLMIAVIFPWWLRIFNTLSTVGQLYLIFSLISVNFISQFMDWIVCFCMFSFLIHGQFLKHLIQKSNNFSLVVRQLFLYFSKQ